MMLIQWAVAAELVRRGHVRNTLIVLPIAGILFALLGFVAGEGAVGLVIRLILFGAVLAIPLLGLLAIAWGLMWLVAMFGPADKPKARGPIGQPPMPH